MASKRRKSDGSGVPEWVVTFGDMMSLLLCFFILLQSLSELKRDHEYVRVIDGVKEAFGRIGGVGDMSVTDESLKAVVRMIDAMAVRSDNPVPNLSRNAEQGIDGPDMRVTKIREGIMFTVGGPGMFEPLTAEIREPVRQELLKIVPLLQGRRNKIEVVGHAASKYLPPESRWRDLDELSFARAVAVRDLLVEQGIDPRVLRLKAVGDREPVRARATRPEDAAENRRVDVILTEMLVDDLDPDAEYTDADRARGG